VRVEPYPPLPKIRPVEAEVATWSETDPMDATVKPPPGHDSDRSLRPLPSKDGPQQPKRVGAARLRAHTPSVALGNSPQATPGAFSFYPHGNARPIAVNIAKLPKLRKNRPRGLPTA
jgi:hypothetical protein